jgi:cyclase
LLRNGADKVSVNTAAIARPDLLKEISSKFGSQVLVLSVDAKRNGNIFQVTTHGGRELTGINALEWIKQACDLGVGEILLNSMDADGTQSGFDLEMISKVRKNCQVPLIASGGAGQLSDFADAVDAGADALLAASLFHFGTIKIADVKSYLKARGYIVREPKDN